MVQTESVFYPDDTRYTSEQTPIDGPHLGI